jgi:hypothetical protein
MVWDTPTHYGVEEENETQGRDGVRERAVPESPDEWPRGRLKREGGKKRKQTKTPAEAQANEEG